MKIFIGIFGLIIWLPLLQMVFSFNVGNQIQENRVLATAPIFAEFSGIDLYARDGVKWFNDNYGLRNILIKTKNQLDYSIFNTSKRVHVGKNGWLFYKSVIDREQPAVESYLQENSKAVLNGLNILAQELNKRHIQLVVTIGPMKNVFYGDQTPNIVRPLDLNRQVVKLEDGLRGMKNIIFIDSVGILNDVSSRRQVFHKTDFHWNDPAAYEVAKSLVNQLSKFEKKNLLWSQNVSIDLLETSGGEAMFMPLFFPPKEKSLMVRKTWQEPPSIYSENIKPFQWVYEQRPTNANLLQPIVVLGDSFFDGMVRAGLPIYFQKVYRAHWNSVSIPQLVNELPKDTRYVFLEFIEVSVGSYQGLAKEVINK
ncbi:hypothetical protein [Polynucleobacter sp. UB-Raua-W9]|uniref:alginate O-acetyltransferase AlgX-related protein n=1 Tax=Polynucleobacter sp. UB-Raua-W9 TaxID=1819736 RepID=UPI001BFE67FD|nr:hypothetical protein [Polynucleobacter sp. UB-Raua-W9]QWD72735.1 hypothetical protein AOC07_01750 [Polynucleobacter sp. UB-Raua-W9]